MKRTLLVRSLALFFLAALVAACAPSPAMIATLTQLPITPSPVPPTPYPTFTPNPTRLYAATVSALTPSPTATITPTPTPNYSAMTQTAVACSSFGYDTSVPSPDSPDVYIGRHYDDRRPPTGMTWVESGPLSTPGYGWAHVQVQGRDLYWVRHQVCKDASGQPYWEIVDALPLPALDSAKNEVTANLCFRDQKEIPFAVAYGSYDPSQPAKAVVGSYTGWSIHVEGAFQMLDRFVPLNPQGLTCIRQSQ